MNSKGYRKFFGAAFIIIFTIIAVTLSNVTSTVAKREQGNGAGNRVDIIQAGYVALQGEYVYYIDYQNNRSGILHRVKKDGSDDVKLINDVFQASIEDDWIYYVTDYNTGNRIYRAKTDGNQRQLLVDPQRPADSNFTLASTTFLDIAEGAIFYSYTDKTGRTGLYRMNKDGNGKTKVADDVLNFYIYDREIFFKNKADSKLYRMNIYGEDKNRMSTENTCSVGLLGNHVYYKNTDNPGIVRMTSGGGHKEQIVFDNKVDSILNVFNEWVYYTRTDGTICKVRNKVGPTGNTPIVVKSFQ